MAFAELKGIVEGHGRFNESTMPEIPAWPDEMIVRGDLRQWQQVVFMGEQIVAAIWMSREGKLQIDGYPFDQMVLVLEGSVTLHPDGGVEETHGEGDVFFVSKGYRGTWEMPGNYKELIAVEKNAWVEVEGE